MSDSVSFDILFRTNKAERALDNLATKVEKVVRKLDGKFDNLDRSLRNVVVDMRALNRMKFGGLNKSLDTTNKQMTSLERNMKKINSLESKMGGSNKSKGGSLGSFGGNRIMSGAMGLAGGVGAYAIGAEVKRMFDTGVDFEYSMKRVQTILGETDESFSSLKNTISEVASNTSFTLADVGLEATVLAKAGWQLGKIEDSLLTIANLGISSGTDPEKAADLLSTASNIWGIDGKDDMSGVADVMTGTVNSFKTSMDGLNTAYQYAGALLAKGGTSFLDSNVAIGVLADRGFRSSKIGTSLRTYMAEMLAPKPKTLKTLDKYSMTLTEVVDGVEKIKDFDQILPDLAQWSDAELKDSFGKVAFAQISSLIDSYADGTFEIYKEKISKMRGVTEDQANKMLETTQGQLDLLGSAWSKLSVKIFNSLDGKDGIIGSMTRLVNYISEFNDVEVPTDYLDRAKDGWQHLGWFIKSAVRDIESFHKASSNAGLSINKWLFGDKGESGKVQDWWSNTPFGQAFSQMSKGAEIIDSSDGSGKEKPQSSIGKGISDGINWLAKYAKNDLSTDIDKLIEKAKNLDIKDLSDLNEKDANTRGEGGNDGKVGSGGSNNEELDLTSPLTSVANQMSRSVVVNMDALMKVENQYIGTSGGELSTEDIESQLSEALIHIVSDYELAMSH